MFKRYAPIVIVSLLSGCSLTSADKNHQILVNTIQQSETNLSNKLTNLELQISNQADYIESLETDVQQLNDKLDVAIQATPITNSVDEPATESPVEQTSNTTHQSSIILGAIEKVTIESMKQSFDARIDTGAATSSLNAIDIQEFERNGKKWVKFHLTDGSETSAKQTDKQADKHWIEAPIIRYVKIRQSTTNETERRAAIELWVKVGKIHEKAQFTLADRSQMSNPVLLGREFIKDIALVDVSKKYLHTDNKTEK
ncbi:ATP-dependent zinc protease [Vibrio clamense]|uniref:putative ATP-dependent zinc protease n=1 Tax=Vibrio clamense TaxID=2910254 RepID=UPI003D1E1067